MSRKMIDITGKRYGRLVVISHSHTINKKQVFWNVLCDCGNTKVVFGGHMKYGDTKSCGCYMVDQIRNANQTHGECHKSKEWTTWRNMKTRCLNPKNHAFKNYGGRGIKICDEWINSFEKFLADMGRNPGRGYSIERIDNELGYFRENCKWATVKEQNANTRRSLKNRVIIRP